MVPPFHAGDQVGAKTMDADLEVQGTVYFQTRKHLYLMPPQVFDSQSPDFVPYALHDVVFTALRHVVFQVDRRSSTPIAHLMRSRLSDGDVFALINEYHTSVAEKATKSGWKSDISKQKSRAKPKSLSCVKLRAKIEEARSWHATRLREQGMRDVDVLYRGDAAKLRYFIRDKEFIVNKVSECFLLYVELLTGFAGRHAVPPMAVRRECENRWNECHRQTRDVGAALPY